MAKKKDNIPEEEIPVSAENEQTPEPETAEETPVKDERDDKIEALALEIKGEKDKYLRLAAEYDNFRKRTQREKEAIADDVKANTVAQLLPVIDNIERALSFDDADEADIRKGIEMVKNQAVTIFDKLGITAFCEVGDVFDPNLHNCIGMAAVDGFESGQITMVIQKGYKLGEKVVRPAMVQVAE